MKISIDNHSYYNFKEIRGYINFMHHPSGIIEEYFGRFLFGRSEL